MARHSVVRNPLRRGYAVLTPEVFRSIDLRARKHVGSVFEIATPEAMHGCLGLAHTMAGDVFTDIRKLRDKSHDGPIYDSASVLAICNQVNVVDFHGAKRPEIDLAVLPADRIYDYVSWHEIGHLADNFDQWDIFLRDPNPSLGDKDEVRKSLHRLNEILADRFAWTKMFPSKPLPVQPGQQYVAEWAKYWVDRFSTTGVRRGRGKSPALDPHPLTSVPTAHVQKGIPWSTLAKSETAAVIPLWLAGIKRAQSDLPGYELRSFGALAQRMAMRWARIAENPTVEAMNYNRKGIISSYQFDDEKASLLAGTKSENVA